MKFLLGGHVFPLTKQNTYLLRQKLKHPFFNQAYSLKAIETIPGTRKSCNSPEFAERLYVIG